MLSPRLIRVVATLCGLLSVLCAAVSAPILFSWILDSTRPISVAPLLISAALAGVAGALFVIRRALLASFAPRPGAPSTPAL